LETLAAQAGIKFLGSYQDISTTATFSGNVTVSLQYDPAGIPAGKNEADLQMHPLETGTTGTQWAKVTTGVDTASKLVTGRVSPFSWFALGFDIPVIKPVGLQPPLASLWPYGEALPYPDRGGPSSRGARCP